MLVCFFDPAAVVVDDVGDGLAVVHVLGAHSDYFSLHLVRHRLRKYHLLVTVHLHAQVAIYQEQLVQAILVDEHTEAGHFLHDFHEFAAVADLYLVAELDVVHGLVHVEHSVEVAGVGCQDLHALLAVEQRDVVDCLHVAELSGADEGAVLAADRVGLNCAGHELVPGLYHQHVVVVEGAVDLDGLVDVGLSSFGLQHSQLKALRYLDGIVGDVHALDDNCLPNGCLRELEELEVVELGDDLLLADCEDEALVAVEETGVLRI